MSEVKIIQAIANACQDPTLYFQVIVQDYTLHVYMDRQNDYLDFQSVTVKIYAAVTSLDWLKINEIYLYSRIIGETKSDWQTWLRIKRPGEATINHLTYLAQEIATEIEDTGSLISELSDAEIPDSLANKVVADIETTESLANELKERSQTKTVDTLSLELSDVSTEELKSDADRNSDQKSDRQINLTKSSPASTSADVASPQPTSVTQNQPIGWYLKLIITIWLRLVAKIRSIQ